MVFRGVSSSQTGNIALTTLPSGYRPPVYIAVQPVRGSGENYFEVLEDGNVGLVTSVANISYYGQAIF